MYSHFARFDSPVIGLFKNPTSHRNVDFEDPTEVSEMVLLADLLLRILDRVEADVAEG